MALTYAEFIVEIRAEVGANSNSRFTETRAARFLNRAIQDIARNCPGLRDLHVLDKLTWSLATDTYEYSLSDFIVPIAAIMYLRYVDTTNTNYFQILPFDGNLDLWTYQHPYIPADNTGEPIEYMVRGSKLEVYPSPSSTENEVPVWVDYNKLPYDIATSTVVLVDTLGATDGFVGGETVTQTTSTATGTVVSWDFTVGGSGTLTLNLVSGTFDTVDNVTGATGDMTPNTATTSASVSPLTDFDEEVIQLASAYALALLEGTEKAQKREIHAWSLINARWDNDKVHPISLEGVDWGP